MKKTSKIIQNTFIAILTMITSLQAQTTDTAWTRTLGGPGYQDVLTHVIPTSDGNYVAAGIIWDENTQTDIWIVKFSQSGEIIWNNKYYTDTLQPWLSEGVSYIFENDNLDMVVFAQNSEYKHYMLHITPDGDLNAVINYKQSEDPYYVYCATAASDNEFIIAGDFANYSGGNWYHYSWYRKIDASGNMIWEKSFPCPKWQDRFYCISPTNDGGFILAGTSDTESQYDDLLIHRITPQGDTLWTRRWGNTSFDHPYEIANSPDGGFILACHKNYMSSYDGYLLKLDAQGHEVWYQEYNSYSDDEIHSVKITPDGGLIVTGQYTPAASEQSYIWVMKTDSQGSLVADFTIQGERGYGEEIIRLADGGSIGVGKYGDDAIIFKVNPSFGQFGIDETLPGVEQVYPNPTAGQFKVQRAKGKVEFQSLELIDIYGNILEIRDQDCQLPTANCQLDISHLPSGIYFIRIQSENQTIVKKIIKL